MLPRPKRAILGEQEVALGDWSIAGAEELGAAKMKWAREFSLTSEQKKKRIQLSLGKFDKEVYRIKTVRIRLK